MTNIEREVSNQAPDDRIPNHRDTESPTNLADLSVGTELPGTVTRVELFGAFVDIGIGVDGLVHISQISKEPVNRVADFVAEGDEVTVWVKDVDDAQQRLELTMIAPPTWDINSLQSGMKLNGRVKRVTDFGAFVDIDAGTDGLVHVSELSKQRVAKPSDVLTVGDEVTVWVKKISPKQNRISLTMIEPPQRDIRRLEVDDVVSGTVTRLEDYGAFVDIGVGRDALLHVREMDDGYVPSPSAVVSVGDEVEVRVIKVDHKKRKIDVSMKDLRGEAEPEIEPEEAGTPTLMELAFQRAMTQQKPETRPSKKKKKGDAGRRQSQQDDIIARTLRQHQQE